MADPVRSRKGQDPLAWHRWALRSRSLRRPPCWSLASRSPGTHQNPPLERRSGNRKRLARHRRPAPLKPCHPLPKRSLPEWPSRWVAPGKSRSARCRQALPPTVHCACQACQHPACSGTRSKSKPMRHRMPPRCRSVSSFCSASCQPLTLLLPCGSPLGLLRKSARYQFIKTGKVNANPPPAFPSRSDVKTAESPKSMSAWGENESKLRKPPANEFHAVRRVVSARESFCAASRKGASMSPVRMTSTGRQPGRVHDSQRPTTVTGGTAG
jgi:hypothetical protein